MLSNNTTAMYNNTNETQTATWTYSDWMKFQAFWKQLLFASDITYILLAIITVLGNTLVLVATWRVRSLHQPNKYFVCCLAVADLLVGIFVVPWSVYKNNLDHKSRRALSIHLCRFASWIDTFALSASIYSLTFISFDRCLKIRKPLQYRSKMTTSKSIQIIFIIGLISTAFATYAATPYSERKEGSTAPGYICPSDPKETKVFNTVAAVIAFFLPTLVMLVVYTLIFAVVHKRQKMLRNGELGQTCNNRSQRTVFLQDLKVIRMFLVVAGVFILCWGPSFIEMLLWYYHPVINWSNVSFNYWYWVSIVRAVIVTLPFVNSICNPIIYACLDQKYREAFKIVLRRMICRGRQISDAMELHQPRTR